ncbi:MAG: NADH-quinone oxidoreductase subunit J [Chloroflexi bacterium]|nr:NADH-quinone oxidoreductase subunit J [Chloroflexota bacterium]
MDKLGLVLIAAFCAIQAIQAKNLLVSVLWLASVSALTTIILFTLDAPHAAVIELSVGAGLVTVLLVFAISIAGGETPPNPESNRKKSFRLVPLIAVLLVLAWIALPLPKTIGVGSDAKDFAKALWHDRALDVLLQIVLIFSAVLSLLGLLAGQHLPAALQHQAHALDEEISHSETVEISEDAPILELERELV